MLKELLTVSIDVVEQFGVCDVLSYAMGREFTKVSGVLGVYYVSNIDQVLLSTFEHFKHLFVLPLMFRR